MADEDEGPDHDLQKRTRKMTASLLCKLPPKTCPNSDAGSPKLSISDPNAPWIAVRGSKTAVIVNDRRVVEVVDVVEAGDGRKVDQKTILMQNQVMAMAFSACGEFIAIADDSGTLSLYKSNGELLFGHRVARAGGADSVVAIEFATVEGGLTSSDAQDLVLVTASGTLLRLGDLRLAEFEQLLKDKPKEALRVIMRNIRFERTNAGRLNEGARSCMLVHRVHEEVFIILGNHGAHLSVWKASLNDNESRTAIEKVSIFDDSTLAHIDSMMFDSDYKRLVLLSEGKLSWWKWPSAGKLFEADITGIGSFAVFGTPIGEGNREDASLLVVSRISDDNNSAATLELVRIAHSEPGDNSSACALSGVDATDDVQPPSKCVNVALFGRFNGANEHRGLVAYRTEQGVSMRLLTSHDDAGNSDDEKCDSEGGEVSCDEDIVTIAQSLTSVPVSSLLRKRAMKKYQVKLNMCAESIGEDEDVSRTVLKYLLQVAAGIREFTSSSPRSSSFLSNLLRWCNEISELSYKWTTFQLLRSSSSSDGGADGKTLREKWDLFRTIPVVDMLEKYVKLGSMRSVMILWSRHLDDEAVRNIGKLVRCLPASLPLPAYAEWIQHEVIPTLIRHVEQLAERPSGSDTETEPDNQPLLVELALWILERSEAAAAEGDVDTAIRICNLLKIDDSDDGIGGGAISFYEFKLQSSTATSFSASLEPGEHNKEPSPESDAFERIEALCQKLQHVKLLAVEHHFVVALSVFEGETPTTIAMSMLDRVFTPDDLKKEVEDHVKRYLRYCDVHVDPVLHDYVTELAESIQTSQSAEETRALVLLDEIEDANVRADATLALLWSALPPYSQALKSYANCTKSWKTERLEEIEEHLRLMEIQDMLTRYGITEFDIADAKSASRMVFHILNQVSRPSAFADAMLLVDAYGDLHCDRAAVQFTENLLANSAATLSTDENLDEVEINVKKAMNALAEVKRRNEPRSHTMFFVSLMEEIIEFGVMLLEMEAEELAVEESSDHLERHSENKPHSFVLRMLVRLAAAYLPELKSIMELADSTRSEDLTAYIDNPTYLLSDALVADLQRICRVEAQHGVLLSLSLLRDPGRCEMKLKQLMKPELLFTECGDNDGTTSGDISAARVTYDRKGKGKKRAVASNEHISSVVAKRQRTNKEDDPRSLNGANRGLQQDDDRTRLIFDLNRFASAVGLESNVCQSLIAQSAASSGCVLQAVRFSRDLFSRRGNTGVGNSSSVNAPPQHAPQSTFQPAETLKKIAISLSLYTSTHVKDIYDILITRNQQLPAAQVARIQAPIYTLELLKYSLCICDKASFDETLILLKNTMLVNEVLQFTQYNILEGKADETHWELYPRWYRGDACVLPSYESMKLATRFAIAEHKNLRRDADSRDTIASKRYVSFLVEQRADLLSLQALLSMQELPENAASVVNTQMGKLLSTVFQSQEIDNYLALGLMLSMKLEDAFQAFRTQISRENIAKDFYRFQQLAHIGADAARAWQEIAFLHQCVELEGNARWWHYLNLLGIECDHKAFQSKRRDLQYIRSLVPTLITRSNYDFYTVLEFTRHYQIDDNFPSLVYAETLLLEASATTNLEYQDKIVGVLEDIHEQHLIKLLLKSIPKVSGQDYDRLLFIFRLLLENTSYRGRNEVERRIDVLRNLKAFAALQGKGKGNPTENHDQEVAVDSEASCKSTISMQGGKASGTRISFHDLIADPSEVLAQLVTKENFSALIGLAEPLRLEPDELQMLLLKNMITTNLRCNKSEDNTSLVQFSAFESILGCLSDTESRVTAAEWLAENFPLGEDKLKALEFALKAAISGGNGPEDPSNTSFTGHEALTRLETKILRVKVELLLRNGGSQTSSLVDVIDDKEQTNDLLALVSEPSKLFLELYRRYALWFYTHSNSMLHKVVDSIAELLQLPQAQLRLDLIREWLVKDAVHIGKEISSQETKEDPFELLDSEKLLLADEDYGKRILYLATAHVKRGDSFGEQLLSYLIEFAKDTQPRVGVTFRAKMRALRVILRLGQLYHAAVERFVITKYGIASSNAFFKELLSYTKHCTHMMTFEEHRVPYEMPFVLKSDKEVLTRSFLRRFPTNEPWVLRCASQMMLDFAVEASDLWEDILSRMLRLGMVRSLANVMGPLSRKSFVRSLECGRRVWEDVLTLPMTQLKLRHNNQANFSSEAQERSRCADTLCFAGIAVPSIRSALDRVVALLQRCPFLDQIDTPVFVIHLRDLAEMCEEEPNGAEIVRQLDLFGFAVKCAMIIPKPVARFEALVRIIHAGAYGSVLHELLDISCFLEDEHAMEDSDGEFADNFRLVQESFSEAAKREDYSAIWGTPFEKGFVEYLAATGNIDYLLSQLLEDRRMETALTAVELYYEYHPSAAPSLDAAGSCEGEMAESSNKRWELIDAYLASSNSPP
ncbi:hypothetical protein PF008_g7485 [Phytophthora fragariae]|uniref:Uncharacterized protein n=1 Tax=Phytophthora fragariae TaxID=53985 RepID=A0A6G0S2B7_9STRA|nr:hypothetical protein PF008_g7485 [Phytophthora fragariae]